MNLCDLFNSNSNLLDPGKCPYKSPPKRGGENRQDKSAEIYMRETNNGKRQLTAARERDLNLKVFSIQRYPHLIEPWWKFCGEPLHDSQGIIYHMFKHIRAECRTWDLGQPFYARVLAAKVEVDCLLNTLTLGSNQGQSVLAPLHRQSNALASQVEKKIEQVRLLVVERDSKLDKLNSDGDLDEDDTTSEEVDDIPFVPDEVLEEEVRDLNQRINQQYKVVKELPQKCNQHSDNTKYGHYIRLVKGLTEFQSTLNNYLNKKCKRPQGFIEFALNNAIELFGGQFMAEHSGFEQTNKNALVS